MSGAGLAPSKSTVYVSNLPFSLTNNDLHKVFGKYGKVVKVTIVKDRVWRRSKGVAFVLFLKREEAVSCAKALNDTQLFGRTIKCSIAKDNGRCTEFIRKKEYTDKSRCYECGEEGHLSYACPKNALGVRDPPPKKKKKRKYKEEGDEEREEEEEVEGEEEDLETLGAAILMEAQKHQPSNQQTATKRKRIKKNSYFSDEEELSE